MRKIQTRIGRKKIVSSRGDEEDGYVTSLTRIKLL